VSDDKAFFSAAVQQLEARLQAEVAGFVELLVKEGFDTPEIHCAAVGALDFTRDRMCRARAKACEAEAKASVTFEEPKAKP